MQIINQYIYDNGKKRYKLDHEKKMIKLISHYHYGVVVYGFTYITK